MKRHLLCSLLLCGSAQALAANHASAARARPWLVRIDALLFSGDERGAAGRMSIIAFLIRVVSAFIAFASAAVANNTRWQTGREIWLTAGYQF